MFTATLFRTRRSAIVFAVALVIALVVALAGVIAPLDASSASARSVSVSTTSQLKYAISNARPGTTIVLKDGTYTGTFFAKASGRKGKLITLRGSRKAIITSGSTKTGTGITVTGRYWAFRGFTIKESQKGFMLKNADHTVIDRVRVAHTGQQGIFVKHGSSYVTIKNSVINDVGRHSRQNGEGIHVGTYFKLWKSEMGSSKKPDRSDHVTILDNDISETPAEGIDIKEGTRHGLIKGNTFTDSGTSGYNFSDSWVDIKGNNYTVTRNSGRGTYLDAFQVHSLLKGWGNHNTFGRNGPVARIPGYEVNIGKGTTDNVVRCHSSKARKGLSNQVCD